MPDIEVLMEAWPPEVEEIIGNVNMLTPELDLPLEDYARMVRCFWCPLYPPPNCNVTIAASVPPSYTWQALSHARTRMNPLPFIQNTSGEGKKLTGLFTGQVVFSRGSDCVRMARPDP